MKPRFYLFSVTAIALLWLIPTANAQDWGARGITSNLAQANSEQKSLTGIAGEVDNIARQITVLIDSTQHGNGSGVIIAREGNTYYVLTAAHVLKNSDSYSLVAPDGNQYKLNSETISLLKGLDLAVVQFTSERIYQVATLAKYSLGVAEERLVFLSGFPASTSTAQPQRRLTAGMLLSKEYGARSVKDLYSLAPTSGYEMVYSNISQPGMSGGAVLDTKGRLIGIHAASEGEIVIRESGQAAEIHLGRSLGVPIETFLALAAKTKVQPQWLNLETDKPAHLSESEINSIQEKVFQEKEPPQDATEVDWLNWGNYLWRVRRYEESVAAFDKAIALNPDFYQAYYARGFAFGAQEKYQLAFESFEQAIQIEPQFYQAWREQALYLHQLDKNQEALAAIDRAIALEPQDWILYQYRSAILLQLIRYQEAIAASDRAIALNPEHPDSYLRRAVAYMQLEQYDAALADLDRAIALNPENAQVYYWRGIAYRDLKESEKAIAAFERAIQINPEFYFSYFSKAWVYSDLKQYDKALVNYAQAVKINPKDPALYMNRAFVYIALEDYNQAIADLSQAIELDPQNADAYGTRCIVYNKLEAYQKAIADCDKAIEYPTDYATARWFQDLSDNPAKNLNVGEGHKYWAYTQRAFAYTFLSQYPQAIADFTAAIKINPDDAFAYELRGTVYRLSGDNDSAIADYSKIIELEPNNVKAYASRGDIYLQLQQYDKAIAD